MFYLLYLGFPTEKQKKIPMLGLYMKRISNCKICGEVFVASEYDDLCKSCKVKDDELYIQIREYLLLHPNRSISSLAVVFNIDVKTLMRYVDDGRLFPK